MTTILSFSFISLVALGTRMMVTVDTLGTPAQEVVVVQQLLLPCLGGQLGVQVADPRLTEAPDASKGGHRDGGPGERDHAVGLTRVIKDAEYEKNHAIIRNLRLIRLLPDAQIHSPAVCVHFGVADFEPVNIKSSENFNESIKRRHFFSQELLGFLVQELDILSLLFVPEEVCLVTQEVFKPPPLLSARHLIPLATPRHDVVPLSGLPELHHGPHHDPDLVPDGPLPRLPPDPALEPVEAGLVPGPTPPAAVAHQAAVLALDVRVRTLPGPETSLGGNRSQHS